MLSAFYERTDNMVHKEHTNSQTEKKSMEACKFQRAPILLRVGIVLLPTS